jgi:hypothetical protein
MPPPNNNKKATPDEYILVYSAGPLDINNYGMGTYSVVVPWNHMKSTHWVLAAMVAGDDNWEDTKARAWKYYPAEAIKFVYSENNELQAVRYVLPSRGLCGQGYKGQGMTSIERRLIEAYCVEINDVDDGPYVYEVRK